MDSFLEEPRTTPKPTPVIQTIETPTVPEVSLMFQNLCKEKSSPVNYGKQTQSYNAWKLRSNSNNNEFDSFLLATGNKENIQQNNIQEKSFLTKKQVRFQSPIDKATSASIFPVNKHIEHVLPSTNYKRISENTIKFHDNSMNHPETYASNSEPTHNVGNTNPIRVDSNTFFQPPSINALKRLETLGINNETRSTTPKSTQFMNSLNPANNCSINPFERMYCLGIATPNKELDLSFLEPQKNPCPRQEYFKRSISDSPTTNYVDHYNKNTVKFDRPFVAAPTIPKEFDAISSVNTNNNCSIVNNNKNNLETETAVIRNADLIQTETKSVENNESLSNNITQNNATTIDNKKSTNEGPSVNDLLQIIKLQNEQLQRLQNQVEKLVKLSEYSQKEKAQTATENTNKNITSYTDQQIDTKQEIIKQNTEANIENNLEKAKKKISVGMMTSFEVSFKPPPPKKKNKTKLRNIIPVSDFSNNEYSTTTDDPVEYPKRQQRVQEDNRNSDYSKRNRGNNHRDERTYPNSWQNNHANKITNETEYSLGSEQSLEVQDQPESPENSIHIDMQDYDTESEDSDDECSTDAGWTFYKDILGQVNNILENSNRPAYRPNKLPSKRNVVVPTKTETTLEQIQQNTIKRLQNDGFLQQSDHYGIQPNEISFAVKQILMKYLPDDGLADVVTKNKPEERYNSEKRKPTDISVTAVKYMQQCNVVTNNPQYNNYARKQKTNKNQPPVKNQIVPSSGDPKILDITTLKQQPKLL